MKKLTLTEDYREEFVNYSKNRITRCSHIKNYNHLTNKILNNTFTFLVKSKLTVTNKGIIYWYKNNEKIFEAYGYSDKNIIDTKEQIQENLYHEVFCMAEWLARSLTEGYAYTCKNIIGNKNYELITGKR